MATANSIHSFANFTFSGAYTSESNHLFNRSSTKRNSARSHLDYTITTPKQMMEMTTEIFNKGTSSSTAIQDAKEGALGDKPLVSSLVLSGAEVVADFSGHIRESFAHSHKVYGTENPAALAALGFTTGFSLFSGGLKVRTAIKEVKTAEKISDVAGKRLGCFKIAQGVAQAAGGLVIIPVRILSLAALATTSKVVSTIAGVLGSVGSACFNVVIILAAIGMGMRLHEQRLFRKQLASFLDDPTLEVQTRPAKALEYLKQLASVTPQEKEEIRNAIATNPEFRSLNPQQQSEKIGEKEKLLLLKKEAHLKRLVDEDCIQQIRQKGPAEANGVIEAVRKKSKEKIILTSIGMGLVMIGLALTVTSFLFTGPIGTIVSAAVSLATSVGWILLDGYGLYKEFKPTDPGRYDKVWIFISSVVAVVAVALVFFLSGGIAPLIAAGVLGMIWLAINVACYYRLYKLGKANSPPG
jgi:hypothetical protein